MSWEIVFWYTSILLAISVIGRLFDIANATYQQHSTYYKAQDGFDVIVVAFGLIGLFGLAYDESYFSASLWQAYFGFTMAYVPISFWTPKYAAMKEMYGNESVIKAILSNTLLMMPSHIAQYHYAFDRVWLASG